MWHKELNIIEKKKDLVTIKKSKHAIALGSKQDIKEEMLRESSMRKKKKIKEKGR